MADFFREFSPVSTFDKICEVKICYYVLGAIFISLVINFIKTLTNFKCCSLENGRDLVVSAYLQSSQIIMVTIVTVLLLWYFGINVNDEKVMVMTLAVSVLFSILLVNGVLLTLKSDVVTSQNLSSITSYFV